MTIDNKWLMKVRALLAKAEDRAATPEEAEALTEKATELMAKYGIAEALAAARADTKQTPGNRIIDFTGGSYTRERRNLLGWIAHEVGCGVVNLTGRGRGRDREYRLHLFGFEADLDRAVLLYTSLLVQMANGVNQAYKPYGENTTSFRKSWMHGFSLAVTKRIGEVEARAKRNAEQEQPAGAPGVALVLADRATLVQQAKEAMYPQVAPARKRQLKGSGVRAGYAAGEQANIGGTGLTHSSSTGQVVTDRRAALAR